MIRANQAGRRHPRWALAFAALALLVVARPAAAAPRGPATAGRLDRVKSTSTRRPLNQRPAVGPRTSASPLGRRARAHETLEVLRAKALAQSGRARADLHQFFTTNPGRVRSVLSRLDLSGHVVIELGVGTGIITKEILRKRPVGVVGFEIDPELVALRDDRLEVVAGDFTRADLSVIGRLRSSPTPVALIANPPYKQLPFIKREIIDRHDIRDVLLMIPARRLKDFPVREGYRVVAELTRDDFSPRAAADAPRHLLIARGFAFAKTSPRRAPAERRRLDVSR